MHKTDGDGDDGKRNVGTRRGPRFQVCNPLTATSPLPVAVVPYGMLQFHSVVFYLSVCNYVMDVI